MRNLFFLPLVMLVVLIAVGCQNDPYPVESGSVADGSPSLVGQFLLPPGATLESANMFIYVALENNQTVDIHRVTAPWDEATITWNNFGGAYDATIIASFDNNTYGWISIDITSLVHAWLNGVYPNYGLLMDQIEKDYPRSKYFAREDNWFPPYLEVCYTTTDGSVCENVADVADAYIWELHPDANDGSTNLLYTGWLDETDLEKQSLLVFDIEYEPYEPDGGCTRTIGFWGNWDGFGPQPDSVTQYLPQWLGNAGGTASIHVENTTTSSAIIGMEWDSPKNGIIKLYAQLLAAKLNFAAGADDSAVADVVSDADDFLADHGYADWYTIGKTAQKMVLGWMETLDDYNNGYIGPGHCDDGDYDDEEDDD